MNEDVSNSFTRSHFVDLYSNNLRRRIKLRTVVILCNLRSKKNLWICYVLLLKKEKSGLDRNTWNYPWNKWKIKKKKEISLRLSVKHFRNFRHKFDAKCIAELPPTFDFKKDVLCRLIYVRKILVYQETLFLCYLSIFSLLHHLKLDRKFFSFDLITSQGYANPSASSSLKIFKDLELLFLTNVRSFLIHVQTCFFFSSSLYYFSVLVH